ncbi:MAG: endonuclease Q family protein, partial [Desulfatirhabdiaceae bacterium]|nr:endonuclease Q family protein [Desulfatirhabdiaceae bacterium]
MKFIADFHIHSRFSRATSKKLDLEQLYISAQTKGITVIATGDITHPEWFKEISEKLEPAEPGLYRLKKNIEKKCEERIPQSCRGKVRFVLNSEISCIYKKNGKIRKNHNLIFLPDLAVAETFNRKLARIGNIVSDGRPILGLDARNMLEMLLETNEQAFLVPAHIWTPWFSLLGSKSGFDSLKECFDDLSSHIFAVETGLSSNPVMNWRVSFLDGLALMSNSDAHSPDKLGREANIFDTELSYFAIKKALQYRESRTFLGTYEFYPEEGKYYFDGHRNCNVRFSPERTLSYGGKCPVCNRPLTIGVLNRVEELCDRKEGEKPQNSPSFYSIISLKEIISEILKVGSGSKKVMRYYQHCLNVLGPELAILDSVSLSDIESAGVPMLKEAIKRMREGNIHIIPGYDGEFGKIRIFKENEK